MGTVGAAAISWALGCIWVDNRDGEEVEEVTVSSSECGQGRVTIQIAIKAILDNLFATASGLVMLMTEE